MDVAGLSESPAGLVCKDSWVSFKVFISSADYSIEYQTRNAALSRPYQGDLAYLHHAFAPSVASRDCVEYNLQYAGRGQHGWS